MEHLPILNELLKFPAHHPKIRKTFGFIRANRSLEGFHCQAEKKSFFVMTSGTNRDAANEIRRRFPVLKNSWHHYYGANERRLLIFSSSESPEMSVARLQNELELQKAKFQANLNNEVSTQKHAFLLAAESLLERGVSLEELHESLNMMIVESVLNSDVD